MKNTRKPKGYNNDDAESWSVEDALHHYGRVMLDSCPAWDSNLILSSTIPNGNNLYYCAAQVITQAGGTDWLRENMAASGHPMPEAVYSRLRAAEDNFSAYRRADFHDVFIGEAWIDDDVWEGAFLGIVLLECLRKEFPAYYVTVMDTLYTVLARHGAKDLPY